MHGTYRVLADLTGRQVMNLALMFSPNNLFHNWTLAAKHCKLYCIANLGCQYWLYSRLSGCWAEDPSVARVSYPLIDNPDISATGTDAANAVVAGEMIQHYCGQDLGNCGPVKKVATPAPRPAPVYTPPPTASTVMAAAFKQEPAPKGLPTWAVVLICLVILLAIGALTGAAVMYFRNRRKGRGYNIRSDSEADEGTDYDYGDDYEMQSLSSGVDGRAY
jgi:hypothetical protein